MCVMKGGAGAPQGSQTALGSGQSPAAPGSNPLADAMQAGHLSDYVKAATGRSTAIGKAAAMAGKTALGRR